MSANNQDQPQPHSHPLSPPPALLGSVQIDMDGAAMLQPPPPALPPRTPQPPPPALPPRAPQPRPRWGLDIIPRIIDNLSASFPAYPRPSAAAQHSSVFARRGVAAPPIRPPSSFPAPPVAVLEHQQIVPSSHQQNQQNLQQQQQQQLPQPPAIVSSPGSQQAPFQFFPLTQTSHFHSGDQGPFFPSGNGAASTSPQSPPAAPLPTHALPDAEAGQPGHEENGTDEGQRNADSFADAMRQHPELRSFALATVKTLPFLLIVVLKVCYDHFNTLFNLFVMASVLLYTDHHLRLEAATKQKNRKKLLFILAALALMLLVRYTEDPYLLEVTLLLSMRTLYSLGDLIYYVIVADCCVKFITIGTKTLVTLLPERLVEFRGRGRIYLLIEAVSQFYRCFVPVQPWAAYLLNNYEGYDKIFGTLLVVIYVFWKFSEVVAAGKYLRESYIKFKQNSNFGRPPTNEELEEAGEQCPICHETFSRAIALECGHLFCDQCIGVWFDRETTCPLCRKKIVDDPRYRDGSTAFFIQMA